jgi:hypothetical protein
MAPPVASATNAPAATTPTVFTLMEEKSKRILEAIPTLEQLQELYLWAPHASSSHIKTFLHHAPALKNLETPLVKDPVQVLQLFAGKKPNNTKQHHLHNTAGLSSDFNMSVGARPGKTLEAPDASSSSLGVPETRDRLIDSIPLSPSRFASFNQPADGKESGLSACMADAQADEGHEEWLSPHLERIGIPYINGCEQSDLEAALMDVFSARSTAALDSGQAETRPICALRGLLAPGGRPTYICEDVWKWIGDRAKIQTFCSREEGMDMLFDQISREASKS